jgi:chromosome partitioning protein
MRTIAVCNGKGGCGKSTIATALADECRRRSLRCLVVDCDAPQYTALRWSRAGGVPAVAVADLSDLPRISAGYERVIVDTAGRDDESMRAAIMLADQVLIPVQPTPADLWAAADTIAVVKQAQALRPDLAAALLISRVDKRTTYGRTIRGALEGSMRVLRTEVHQRSDYAAAMASGQGPSNYAPQGKAAAEVRSLFEELHDAHPTAFESLPA